MDMIKCLQKGFATIRQDLKCLKSDIKEIKEVQIIQRSNKSNNIMDDVQKFHTDVTMQIECSGRSNVAKDNSETELRAVEEDGAEGSQDNNNDDILSAIHKETSEQHNEDTTNLGGPWPCKVLTKLLQKCNHDTMEKLVCDLLGVLFLKEELAISSFTGTKSNVSNKAAKKQILYPSKVAAIRGLRKKMMWVRPCTRISF
ncbi:uncharacterized protein LOC105201081 isoform X2 [Solenopsis invicta]|uniref:uncharacterized protein LOC105201081 isoform X2 n=1 Tax=Solenopsis invicta TaxID=13686 RepID=UPI000E33F418|nr:uncharacterized protein LOC105201081 isoform X2 [Solenopsis invicta]